MIGEQLYKRVFSRLLLKCVGTEDIQFILQEVHQGSCGSHIGGRSLARRILLAGYFWPTLHEDANKLVRTCMSCQKHQNISHHPTQLLKTSIVSCPFDQWGMDIVGPFPMAAAQRRFLLVAVDYFSKWVEVEPLPGLSKMQLSNFCGKISYADSVFLIK